MRYRVTASLERLDEEQCSAVIEQIENAFMKARVRGRIFISIDNGHMAARENESPGKGAVAEKQGLTAETAETSKSTEIAEHYS